uniref:Uncharacterized protein n=1 Tax=Nitrosopumivirus cobalaminus TaxID=3158414 RepID=A0AAU7N494_9VIRU
MATISQFEKESGNSISLARIDGQSFTIVSIEKSDYENDGEVTEGIKISVKEDFEGVNVLHTTRRAIVSQLTKVEVLTLLKSESIGPVKCVKAKSASGKDYFKLVDV